MSSLSLFMHKLAYRQQPKNHFSSQLMKKQGTGQGWEKEAWHMSMAFA